jgi:hypothetical protein
MDLFILRMIELDKRVNVNVNIKVRKINLIDYIKKLLN